MQGKRWAGAVIGFLILALLYFPTGCAVNPVTGEHQLMLLSEEDEIRLGLESDSQVTSEYGVYEDFPLTAYLNGMGKKLAKLSHRPGLPYEFKVLDTPVVNAFAVPGGYVYFTRGILANLNSEAELAGVMGHELGHIVNRDAYLKKINGMVYGEDPREGFVENDVFYHPLLRFQFPVPPDWALQNTRAMVQMTSGKKDAAIMFMLSSAKSLEQAARDFVQKNRGRLMASDRKRINGLSAVRTVSKIVTNQGTLEIMSGYVQKGGKVYEFHGLAPENAFRSYQPVFQKTMGGFKQLTNKRMLNRKPYRIQIASVPRTGTVKQALKALGASDRKLQSWAVMN